MLSTYNCTCANKKGDPTTHEGFPKEKKPRKLKIYLCYISSDQTYGIHRDYHNGISSAKPVRPGQVGLVECVCVCVCVKAERWEYFEHSCLPGDNTGERPFKQSVQCTVYRLYTFVHIQETCNVLVYF